MKCVLCGHEWKPVDNSTAKAIRMATKVNGQGPFCNLCYHLEMADRFSQERGFIDLYDAVEEWLHHKRKRNK